MKSPTRLPGTPYNTLRARPVAPEPDQWAEREMGSITAGKALLGSRTEFTTVEPCDAPGFVPGCRFSPSGSLPCEARDPWTASLYGDSVAGGAVDAA